MSPDAQFILFACFFLVLMANAVVLLRRVDRRRAEAAARLARLQPPPPGRPFPELVDLIHRTLVARMVGGRPDWSDVEAARRTFRHAIEHLIDVEQPGLNLIEREHLIHEVLDRIPLLKRPAAAPTPPTGSE